jgi:hypothetical protein
MLARLTQPAGPLDPAPIRSPHHPHALTAHCRHGADSLRQLLNGELGEVLRITADAFGIKDWRDAAAWDRALLEPDAWVRELGADKVVELGVEEPQHVEMELVRCAQRLGRLMPVTMAVQSTPAAITCAFPYRIALGLSAASHTNGRLQVPFSRKPPTSAR